MSTQKERGGNRRGNKPIRLQDIKEQSQKRMERLCDEQGLTYSRYLEIKKLMKSNDGAGYTADEADSVAAVEAALMEGVKESMRKAHDNFSIPKQLERLSEELTKEILKPLRSSPSVRQHPSFLALERAVDQMDVVHKTPSNREHAGSNLGSSVDRGQSTAEVKGKPESFRVLLDDVAEAMQVDRGRQEIAVDALVELVNLTKTGIESANEQAEKQEAAEKRNFVLACVAAGAAVLSLIVALASAIIH